MEDCPTTKRSHVRTNLFVVGTIASASLAAGVRIRNLSERGALIEGDALPDVGERVTLRRGELAATGTVVRKIGNKAGLNFKRPINVSSWLPAGIRTQAIVDAAVRDARTLESLPSKSNSGEEIQATLSSQDELTSIADMLDALADSFSEDPMIVEKYLTRLQVLDIAAQKIRYFARI